MARITVRSVGRRNITEPHCAICGSRRTLGHGVCVNQCFWLLPGWVGYDATLNEVKFLDYRALPLAAVHKWNPETKRKSAPAWPKLVSIARAHGWEGNVASMSQPVFVEGIAA